MADEEQLKILRSWPAALLVLGSKATRPMSIIAVLATVSVVLLSALLAGLVGGNLPIPNRIDGWAKVVPVSSTPSRENVPAVTMLLALSAVLFIYLSFALQDHIDQPYQTSKARELKERGRWIEFAPEHREAGVAILSYFATYVENKYPDESVTVQIEQDGPRVTMTIRTEEGKEDIIEKALEEYGQVVTGQKNPEDVLDNIGHILDLRDQLRSAYSRIESKMETLFLVKAENTRLLNENNTLRTAPVAEAIVPVDQGQAIQAARTEGHLEGFREAVLTITSKPLVHVESSPVATASSKAIAQASATVNITAPVYALQGALKELAEALPTDSPARQEIEAVDAGLENVAKETDAEAVQKSPQVSRLKRFMKDLGDAKSDLSNTIRGVANLEQITGTVLERGGELMQMIGELGKVVG